MSEKTRLSLPNLVSVIALIILNFLIFFFYGVVPEWKILLALNFLILILIYFFSKNSFPRLKFFSDWFPFLILLFIFKETYFLVHPIIPKDFDEIFIKIDFAIFNFNPTVEISKFANPILTEILQISYSSYYFIIIAVPLALYFRKDFQNFDYVSFLILYGFYLSYIGYFLFPGIGPRFTLHDFSQLQNELPGIFFTEPLRQFINYAESIPTDLIQAKDLVHRDLFPSGHTQLTLVSIYFAFKFNIRFKKIILVIGSLLIFSTVYLRYHYVIDVVFGIIFFWFTIWSGKILYSKNTKL